MVNISDAAAEQKSFWHRRDREQNLVAWRFSVPRYHQNSYQEEWGHAVTSKTLPAVIKQVIPGSICQSQCNFKSGATMKEGGGEQEGVEWSTIFDRSRVILRATGDTFEAKMLA